MAGERELIDFADLAAALLQRADTLVPQWLPGGAIRGHEYVCSDLGGGEGGSCSVNLTTGKWADFGGDAGDSGGDLISLYAAIHNLNQGQAARQLMADLGWQRGPSAAPARRVQTPARAADAEPPDDLPPAEDEPGHVGSPDTVAGGDGDDSTTPSSTDKPKKKWVPVVPVPASAKPCDFWHWHYTRDALQGSWEYRFNDALYGYVARFATSDGGKEILPYLWCVDESDGRGTMRWHTRQWDVPRPLYVPATLLSEDPATVPVVLVEGEKCALAGLQLLGHEFDFVSWPGGGNAWAKANWAWLKGRTVYLWADCDSKHKKLTREQRDAGVDPATQPLLDEPMQPGVKAMRNIGNVLAAEHGCTVLWCPVPKPGNVADGWDLADAIGQGWGAEEVRAFIRGAKTFVPVDAAVRAAAAVSTPSRAGADPDEVDEAWRGKLLCTAKGSTLAVRDNIVLAIDGIPEKGMPGIAEAQGVIAYNEFTNDVVKLKPSPWGTAAGVWEENDELELGNWLTREHFLPSMSRNTLEEAVLMIARRHHYHPVRERLEALRGKWDGEKRLYRWVERACLKPDEADGDGPLRAYLERVGTWFVMAMCARVLPEKRKGSQIVCGPGTKFDCMVIFEGEQGVGKSTLASILGGEYYADTGLVLGEKDSYQNLQGVHVYEWGELDSLNKAEVSKVKSFISSTKDRFRASFDRRPKNYPRQVVFIGTTNEDHYLTDPTGNRRFWPVRVSRQIDVAWLRENIDQMFAEALVYVDAGERFFPTQKEQRELFDPQQQQRTVENAIESAIQRYLYDENQKLTMGGENGSLVSKITLSELLGRIGFALDKQTTVVVKQAAAAMRRLGWQVGGRSAAPGRPREYHRPKVLPVDPADGAGGSNSSTHHDAGAPTDEANDGCPF